MWVSKQEMAAVMNAQIRLAERIKKLENPDKQIASVSPPKPPEFIIDEGRFYVMPAGVGLKMVGQKKTTVDKVLRLILRHLNIEVEQTDAKESEVVLKPIKAKRH